MVYSALSFSSGPRYWCRDTDAERGRMRWYSNRGFRSFANRKLPSVNGCRQSSRLTALFELLARLVQYSFERVEPPFIAKWLQLLLTLCWEVPA